MSGRPTDGADGADGGGNGDESFLGRWSARKRRAGGRTADDPERSIDGAADGTGHTLEVPDAATAPVGRSADPAQTVPALTDADMPPLESLDGTSDLSVFLGDGVSATLRKAALRRVFSAAAFNVRDGLNDYDGDYTVFEPLGDTVTADMKFHAARRERAARERAEAEALAQAEGEPVPPGGPSEAVESTDTETGTADPSDRPPDPGATEAAPPAPDGTDGGARLVPPADGAATATDAGDADDRHDTPTETLPPA